MCVSRCLHCVGLSLIPLALICLLSNTLLLLPELKTNFLLEGHVTREATWATGLWGGGFLVCHSTCDVCHICGHHNLLSMFTSALGLLAAAGCSVVSLTGLSQGPLCLYNSTSGLTWGYLYNHSLWFGVCLEPRNVVQWNMILFSLMAGASFLQVLLCAANIINSAVGMIMGHGFCQNQNTNQ
uniref:Si:dkey-83h2.3 n=1 Tax=Takifugu rubripes TaxID=31033 RepID=A0A674MH82_TAKRU